MKKRLFFMIFCSLALFFALSSCGRIRLSEGGGTSGGAAGEGGSTAQEKTVEEQGDEVALVEGEYEKLLREGFGGLYPCQFVLVYAEDEEEYRSFASASAVNSLLLSSGGESVTSSLFSFSGEVSAEFLVMANPELVVKFVGSDILGREVSSLEGAILKQNEILSREELKEVSAVKTKSVLVLSKELLSSEGGKLAARLILARAMYPSLFPSLNLSEAVSSLAGEGTLYLLPSELS